jgi:cytochrome b561
MPTSGPLLPLYDTPTVYGRISRLTHWVGAVMVLSMLALGLVFDELPHGDLRTSVRQLHVTLGVLCLLPLLARVLWRVQALRSGHTPQLLSSRLWTRRTERSTHFLLLAVLLVLVLTGPLSIWLDGDAIHLLGDVDIASPLQEQPGLHRLSEIVHALSSKLLIALLLLHLGGMLSHGRKAWRRMAGQVE